MKTNYQLPEDLTTYFLFLDDLRESGVTNMFGATKYLCTEFPELAEQQDLASAVLLRWMTARSKKD